LTKLRLRDVSWESTWISIARTLALKRYDFAPGCAGACARRTPATALTGYDHAANTLEALTCRRKNVSSGLIGTEYVAKVSPLWRLFVDALVALIEIGATIGGIACCDVDGQPEMQTPAQRG
jgi:hypothetical protein